MLAWVLTAELYAFACSAILIPAKGQLLPHVTSDNSSLAATLIASNVTATYRDCFSDVRLLPAIYSDCLNAATSMLRDSEDPFRLVYFARKGEVGFKLPKTFRHGICVISLDIANDDARDFFKPWVAYVAALGLVDKCAGNDHRLGGKRTVGPKDVVDLMVFGREWPPGHDDQENRGNLLPERSATTNGTGVDRITDALSIANISSPGLFRVPIANTSNLNVFPACFEASEAHEVRFAADHRDCFKAAHSIIEGKPRNVPLSFGRNPNAAFALPATYDYGTCSIFVDVMNADDHDTFELWTLYGAAVDIASRCTLSPTQAVDIWGGERTAGFRGLVKVVIFGISPMSIATAPANAHSNARTQAKIKQPTVSTSSSLISGSPMVEVLAVDGKPGLNTSALISNGSAISNVSTLGGVLTCYDPPLPRERLYPYLASDCDDASEQIIGNRHRWDAYVFSRKPSASPRCYPLPAKFAHGTCVISLDMNNDKDEDFVRVTYVASSAWVLAHKCSGEEAPQDRYGGYMTVSVGGSDLIGVHVYGRPWPPRTPHDSIVLPSQNVTSLDTE